MSDRIIIIITTYPSSPYYNNQHIRMVFDEYSSSLISHSNHYPESSCTTMWSGVGSDHVSRLTLTLSELLEP